MPLIRQKILQLTSPFRGLHGLVSLGILGSLTPAILFGNGLVIKTGVFIVMARGVLELFRLVLHDAKPATRYLAMGLALGVGATLMTMPAGFPMQPLLYGLMVASTVYFLTNGEKDPAKINTEQQRLLIGCLYVPFGLSYFPQIHALPDHGKLWLLGVMLLTAFGDMFAKGIGTAFPIKPMLSHISKGKNWGGFIGQFVGAFTLAFVWRFFVMPSTMTTVDAVALGFLGGLLGRTGDLFESLFKRAHKVKDSGSLLPGGHGGLLDRIDSHLFVLPAAYYWITALRPAVLAWLGL